MRTVDPVSADGVAAVLADASRARERVVIRGAGTKSALALSSDAESDILLSTARLDRVIAHRHGDLTATIEAGAVLGDVNRELERHGQWLPLDPAWSDRATIGGIVATNDSGPRRHRFGAPRDLIIGVEVARADGVRASAGGIVVKNVAGYDLSRLITGSFGCLGVILTATFKLYPRAAQSRTVIVDVPSGAQTRAIVAGLDAGQLTPTAVEVQAPPLRLLIRFESIEASVERQSDQAIRIASAHGGRARVVRDGEEDREWREHAARPWSGSGSVAKVTLLPDDLAPTLDAIQAAAEGCAWEVVGRAGVGVLLLRIDGDTASQTRVVGTLRARVQMGRGSVTLLRSSRELASAVGVWGPMGGAFRVMKAVKAALDPDGLLNPGRGPGGL